MVFDKGKKGIIGTMPSFKGRLNETQVKAVATYLNSIQGERVNNLCNLKG